MIVHATAVANPSQNTCSGAKNRPAVRSNTPESMMPTIEKLIAAVDVNVEDDYHEEDGNSR